MVHFDEHFKEVPRLLYVIGPFETLGNSIKSTLDVMENPGPFALKFVHPILFSPQLTIALGPLALCNLCPGFVCPSVLNVTKMTTSVFDRVEDTVGKGEIACTSNFSFFHNVLKRLLYQRRQKALLCGDGLTLSQTTNFHYNENGRNFSRQVENTVKSDE